MMMSAMQASVPVRLSKPESPDSAESETATRTTSDADSDGLIGHRVGRRVALSALQLRSTLCLIRRESLPTCYYL